MATTPTLTGSAFFSAGVAQLRAATLTREDYANAFQSLVSIDPSAPAPVATASAAQVSPDLAYFQLAPDGTPALVVPVNSPSFTVSPASSPSPAPAGDGSTAIPTVAGTPPGSITVPAGTPCPQGFVTSPSSTTDQIRQALELLPPTQLIDTTIAGACVPATTVTTVGKYITPDDFLSVAVTANTVTTGLTLNARVLDCNGVMHYLSESVNGGTTGAITTYIFAITPGYLLDACVSDPGASLGLGAVNVAIGLQHSSQSGLAPTSLLAQGYVTGMYGVSWPGTTTGAPAASPALAPQPPAGVRGTGIQATSASSYTVSWPAGTLAGDLAIVWCAHAYNPNDPAGWTVLSTHKGDVWNTGVYSKILSGGDILTGSLTLTFAGTYDGVIVIVTFQGSTHWTPTTAAAYSYVNTDQATVSMTTGGSGTPNGGDVALYFAGIENASTVTFNRGTQLQQISDGAHASGALYGETLTAGGQLTAVAQFSVTGSGIQSNNAILIIQL